MAYKLDANTVNDHTIFELMSMVRGTVTMDRHYFFNMVKPATGEDIDFKQFLGGTIPKTEDGKRIPMNKQANNPSLTSPTITGMKYFGQSPLFKAAVDQLHAKKIGVFPTATHGAGMNAFDFQNNNMFQSADSLMGIVGKILFGGQAANITSEAHQLFNPLKSLADQIGKAGGADSKTQINPSSDTQKLIQMCAAGFTKDGQNPFSGSALSDGVTMAKDVSQYIKKLTG
jgi:hypothetical protein